MYIYSKRKKYYIFFKLKSNSFIIKKIVIINFFMKINKKKRFTTFKIKNEKFFLIYLKKILNICFNKCLLLLYGYIYIK